MKLTHLRAVVAATLLGSGGCAAVGPDYSPPEVGVPERFTNQDGRAQDASAMARWWEAVEDPHLDDIIERVLTESLELEAAIERVEASRAAYGITRSSFAPQLNATGGYARARSFFLPIGDQWTVGGNVSWELDLFGRVRRSVEAAVGAFEAEVEDLRAARVALAAEAAATYLQIASLDERLAIARRNVDGQEQSKSIADQRFAAGVAAGLDPAQAEVNLARTRASVPALEIARRRAVHRLAVLTGQEPSTFVESFTVSAALPAFPRALAVGIPADLMRNRPDIRALERDLAAQTARVGLAVASRYPRLQLGGSWEWLALEPEDFFADSFDFGSFGPSVSLPLFTGGQLRSQVEAEEARLRQALLALRQGVLVAQEEVENALVALQRGRQQVELQGTAVSAARRTVRLSRELYTSGQSDFQNVLDAERSLFAVEDELAVARLDVLLSVVDLYRALGGGWVDVEEPAEL